MTRGPWALALAVLTLAVGCDGDGGLSSTTAATTTATVTTTTAAATTLPPPECPEGVGVASAGDLVAVLAATPWEGLGPYTSGPLPITPDLVVTGKVVLEAADLPIPEACLDRSDCQPKAAFRMGAPIAGVTLEGTADLACADGFARLTLQDTTLRFRTILYDTHPCRYNFIPLVVVEPACGSACGEDEALCPADGVCYAAGESFCLLCEGGEKEACACREPGGPLPDGAACDYWESGDVLCEGRCRSGVCTTQCD